MTLEEKRKVLSNFCDNQLGETGCNCDVCPCDTDASAWCKLYNELNCPEDVADEAIRKYNMIASAVNHPSHYTQGNIECIDAMVAAYGKEAVAHFCICNAFKYLWRTEHKNGIQDIEKANWYLNKYKELKSSEG